MTMSKQRRAAPLPAPGPVCREARAFLLIALIAGLLLIWLIPPLCAPDEAEHFANAWAISRGQLLAAPAGNTCVRRLPEDFKDFLRAYPASLSGEEGGRYTYQAMQAASQAAPENAGTYAYDTHIASWGYAVSALSMAAGTALGKLLGFAAIGSAYHQMILGRLGNLLFYVIATYFAIKRAPHFRRTMLLLACLPMSLFLGASLNYDALLIPTALYFAALVLSLSREEEKPLNRGDWIRLLLCALLLSGIKGSGAVLLLLLFALPRRRLGDGKRLALFCGSIALAAVLGWVPSLLQSARMPASDGADPSRQQLQWLLSHPLKVPRLLGVSLKARGPYYIESFFGSLGWLDAHFPLPVMLQGWLALLASAVYEGCTFALWQGHRRRNLVALAVSLVFALGTFLVLYVIHTPLPDVTGEIGGECVEGVQGRYFIPIFLPALLAVSNGWLLGRDRDSLRTNATALSCLWSACCAALTVFLVLARYWLA